jgi:predicted amidohydrolase
VELVVLPAFHLTGGVPAAGRAEEALRELRAWCAEYGCDAVTSLAVAGADGMLRYAITLVTPEGEAARRYVTHLGAQAVWAVPGDEPPRPITRPWGRLGLLAGEELEAFEPSRVLAVLGADVVAVPAAAAWPYPVPFAGTRVPLNPAALRRADPEFAHPARMRAGDSHVWLALANAGPVPSGVFSPDHVAVPREEALSREPGWTVLRCLVRGGDGMGAVCSAKPQLARRRTDLYGTAMIQRA